MTRWKMDPHTVVRSSRATFRGPLKWPSGIVFVCPWSDFFIRDADGWRDDAWDIIRQTEHKYVILTKRPERMLKCLPDDWLLQNVALGVSVELQEYLWRVDWLASVPAAVKVVSIEPMLGPVDLSAYLHCGISWCIIGAESGPKRRPMDERWVRSLVWQCKEAGIAVFYKQRFVRGKRETEPLLDGQRHIEFPQIIDRQRGS